MNQAIRYAKRLRSDVAKVNAVVEELIYAVEDDSFTQQEKASELKEAITELQSDFEIYLGCKRYNWI